ncbi:MAG: hypothetical protein A3A43_01235 [Candidatus Liptonbacteria bacterium RIFCSPLOWO2_01_FULL_56_20]|uniref:Uncharacterized protein n=1 Tax=Candidatus Liptonbacteria bacterium RIFCSPLOWO2_01_FULL_56_20 TaxID=1798652 RepID=A0A1G2CJH3_9BACT|nr:MAG: hypothetical protein A3A43_01235 [Candidatus Liptonbacteria bacterium RIFCSPLOWO2_01_FULL_56_20]
MKRTVFVVLLLSFVPAQQLAAQGFWKELGKAVLGGLPRVEFPAVEQLTGAKVLASADGVNLEKYNLVVRNGARIAAVAKIVAFDKELGLLGPGGVVVDDRRAQWLDEEVPVLAFYYEDAGGELGKYIGLAWGKARFTPSYPSSQPLTFELERILIPDGQWFYGSAYGGNPNLPLPVASMQNQIVHLPRKWWNGTTGMQLGNGSLFHARVRVNGHVVAFLAPEGGFSYVEWKVLSGFGPIRSVQLDWLQEVSPGQFLLVRSQDLQFPLSSWGVRGIQLVIGPPTYGAALY